MLRILAAILGAFLIASCQTTISPQKQLSIRSVAIVSGLADRVQVNFNPLGWSGAAEVQWLSVDWGLDQLATDLVAERLKGKYEIRAVSYRPENLFLAPNGVGITNYGRIGQEAAGLIVSDAERIKRNIPPGIADAIVYIGQDKKQMGFDSPLYVHGLGYTRLDRLGGAINLAHAGYRIVVLDGQTFQIIGEATVDGPRDFYARSVGFYLRSSTPRNQEPALMAELRNHIISMLRNSMATTLAQVGF